MHLESDKAFCPLRECYSYDMLDLFHTYIIAAKDLDVHFTSRCRNFIEWFTEPILARDNGSTYTEYQHCVLVHKAEIGRLFRLLSEIISSATDIRIPNDMRSAVSRSSAEPLYYTWECYNPLTFSAVYYELFTRSDSCKVLATFMKYLPEICEVGRDGINSRQVKSCLDVVTALMKRFYDALGSVNNYPVVKRKCRDDIATSCPRRPNMGAPIVSAAISAVTSVKVKTNSLEEGLSEGRSTERRSSMARSASVESTTSTSTASTSTTSTSAATTSAATTSMTASKDELNTTDLDTAEPISSLTEITAAELDRDTTNVPIRVQSIGQINIGDIPLDIISTRGKFSQLLMINEKANGSVTGNITIGRRSCPITEIKNGKMIVEIR